MWDLTINPSNLHLDCKSFIFRFNCLYRQSYATIKNTLHLELNHPKNLLHLELNHPKYFMSKPAERLWCNSHVGFHEVLQPSTHLTTHLASMSTNARVLF
ncbi:hypothetical protein QL285_056404 [Trifolium repens]|nr:hypothetical protein QL285_056404 [Trifolium repens]